LKRIPEGTDIEFTVLGLGPDPDAPPIYYGKASDIIINRDETTVINMLRGRYGDISCPSDKPSGAPNLMFSDALSLPDGRLFITGGFSKVVEESGRFEITQASKRAFIFDPITGILRQAQNEMNSGRGAHAAIYLPKSQLVLVVGGAERVYMAKDNTCFPFYYLKDKAGTVGFTYELFDVNSERFFVWDSEEWPDEENELLMKARRVFPQVSLNNDGTVLVTGGGQWPSCQTQTETDDDYKVAELYRPKTDNYSGLFMESYGALAMKAMRTGHTAVQLEIKDKRAIHLYWGGTEDGPHAELYTEASGQVDGTFGIFTPVEFIDSQSYKKRPYFHSITKLKDRQFLVIGGSIVTNGKLKVPSAGDAYLIDVKSNNKVAVSSVNGLDIGRYFHTATTFDNDNVVVFGGFTGVVQGEDTFFSDMATDDVRFFSLSTKELSSPPEGVDNAPLPRAGHAATTLRNGCLFYLGGADQVYTGLEFAQDSIGLVAEVYCPSSLCPKGLWKSTCYQD
jgi:hypothetical protein